MMASGEQPSAQAQRPPVLAVVVPCYNEEQVLPETMRRLADVLREQIDAGHIHPDSRAWYVDDGSRDRTWTLIEQASAAPGTLTSGIKLSRNRGHQIALLAGLMQARGDVLISVDADLQDDLGAIPLMLQDHAAGADIVLGVRSARATDSAFKRWSAESYYRLLKRFGVDIVFNHADYRLMSRRAVESLRAFEESNVFLRGMIPLIGYPTRCVQYSRAERYAGESKYPLSKMLALAWQGITSFSAVPLRAITALGALVSLVSLSMGVWALFVRLFTTDALPGWASIVIPQFLLSGVQLLSLGVIGEYVAKIFIETKRRPPYFIERRIDDAARPDHGGAG
jgi:glycosyltransferase involved in cell wall biosynthesis